MTKEYQNICANVRYLRAREGLSRTAMCRLLHITRKTLDSMESGIYPDRCNIGLIMYACTAFHICPRDFVNARLEDFAPLVGC